MPQYRRLYRSGGTIFLTLVTYDRQPLFMQSENVSKLRQAIATVKAEMPFDILGAVILPDHIHFLWALPSEDTSYSKRIGKLKVLFTHSLHGKNSLSKTVSVSRQKHRESNVWQRRFWEHTIRDEKDFEQHFNYIHYNPVKHGLVRCPHLWEYSSFHSLVKKGIYSSNWCCTCQNKLPTIPNFDSISQTARE
ncbi:MAG: transposase [Hydrococcus sp. Prado102]|nr:transposase [Hydrococcus sp. Prado102]